MPTNLRDRILAAGGRNPVDLLFTAARVVDVFSGRIEERDVAVDSGMIVGLGPGYTARRVLDLGGKYLSPGFIDPHLHIESSMTCVTEFARAVLPCGTTTVVADPHEIANVMGTAGIDFMLASAEGQPMNVFYTLSSCVPASHMETSGAVLEARDLSPYLNHERILGLAEMMNYPGVVAADPGPIAKIEAALRSGKPVDGHAPGLGGRALNAYAAAGILSDHECTHAEEALEKLSVGMHIMIREGTGAKNLAALLPIVDHRTERRIMWCTDDRHPQDILEEGHIDYLVRRAIDLGCDPLAAIRMATLNPAEYFGLRHLGAVAPGRQADLLVFRDLKNPQPEQVYHAGRRVAQNGAMDHDAARPAAPKLPAAMRIDPRAVQFAVAAQPGALRVIRLVPNQITTEKRVMEPKIVRGAAVADPDRDLLKLAVVDRHSGTARTGLGFVSGFGLRKGALASSVAHDAHNLIVVGATDEDMRIALGAVVRMGGGLAVASNGRVSAELALPIAGLMSHETVPRVQRRLANLNAAAARLGTGLKDPFMTLSFLALPVIPALKLTDRGLVDVTRFEVVGLFES